MGEIVTWNM